MKFFEKLPERCYDVTIVTTWAKGNGQGNAEDMPAEMILSWKWPSFAGVKYERNVENPRPNINKHKLRIVFVSVVSSVIRHLLDSPYIIFLQSKMLCHSRSPSPSQSQMKYFHNFIPKNNF